MGLRPLINRIEGRKPMQECKSYITQHDELSDLEQEALRAKFSKGSPDKHRAIFCHDARTMILAAPFHVPMLKTQQAIRGLINLYSPDRLEIVSMPRVA